MTSRLPGEKLKKNKLSYIFRVSFGDLGSPAKSKKKVFKDLT